MNYDLHCHSTASDGLFAPRELVDAARRGGVDVLALTDHDELSGLAEARQACVDHGLRFINGVEISVTWEDETIHIVGLGIDPENPQLLDGLQQVRGSRLGRAQAIAARFDSIGISGTLQGALSLAANPAVISRAHFARHLVSAGHTRDADSAFKLYLGSGKPAYVPHHWSHLEHAVRWINGSGGVAVVAHPGRYRLSDQALRRFFGEFRDAGGRALEVVTGSHQPSQYATFARYARDFGLHGSRGSDFHGVGESRIGLGQLPPLPDSVKPVWDLFD